MQLTHVILSTIAAVNILNSAVFILERTITGSFLITIILGHLTARRYDLCTLFFAPTIFFDASLVQNTCSPPSSLHHLCIVHNDITTCRYPYQIVHDTRLNIALLSSLHFQHISDCHHRSNTTFPIQQELKKGLSCCCTYSVSFKRIMKSISTILMVQRHQCEFYPSI